MAEAKFSNIAPIVETPKAKTSPTLEQLIEAHSGGTSQTANAAPKEKFTSKVDAVPTKDGVASYVANIAPNGQVKEFTLNKSHESVVAKRGPDGHFTLTGTHDTREIRFDGWESRLLREQLQDPAFRKSVGEAIAQDLESKLPESALDGNPTNATPASGGLYQGTRPTMADNGTSMSPIKTKTHGSVNVGTTYGDNGMIERFDMESSHGHVTATRGPDGKFEVKGDHNTRELRPKGWEKEMLQDHLKDPDFRKGIGEDAARQLDKGLPKPAASADFQMPPREPPSISSTPRPSVPNGKGPLPF